jgi:N-acetylmuramoyl-L-alanine amidase
LADFVQNHLFKTLFVSLLLLANRSVFAATVITASVLPVSEYTRITFESDQAIAHSMLILKNPDRVVLDLKNASINQSLRALASKVLPDDFYIKKLRVANFKQGVTRIVVDLKSEAKPKLSSYKPAGGYQHRLALDIYPVKIQNDADESVAASEIDAPDVNSNSSNSDGAGIVLEPNPVLEPDAEPPNEGAY